MRDRLTRSAPIPPLTVEARKRIEDAIEMLMARLDADDALTEDLEPSLGYYPGHIPCDAEADHNGGIADDEPSHGSTTAMDQDHAWRAATFWDCDESEPSLGWTGNGRGHPQAAMRGYDQDRELEAS